MTSTNAHPVPGPAPSCLNCGQELAGPWCHRCGQRAQVRTRSLRHVLFEFLEIFSLHSLSFSLFVLTVLVILDEIAGDSSALVTPVLLALPLHLFVHRRGVYGTRPFGTLVRMTWFGTGSLAGGLALLLSLVLLSLQLANG